MERPVTTLFMLMSVKELSGLGVLKLKDCTVLQDSYIRLQYEVVN